MNGEHVDAFGDAGLRVRGFHAVAVQMPGLMHDERPFVGREQRQRLRHRLVERLRAEAAADDQHAQRAAAAGKALGRRRQGLDRVAHRVAGDHRLARGGRRRAVEAERDAIGNRQQRAVAHQQCGIGIDQHQRLAEQRGHQAAGKAHVAAHAEHCVRAAVAQDAQAAPESAEHAHAAGERMHDALAAQSGEPDRVELDAGRRNEAVFHALRGAEPAHAPAAVAHLVGDGEAGDDVSSGAGGHDHEMVGHWVPLLGGVVLRWRGCCSRPSGVVFLLFAGSRAGSPPRRAGNFHLRAQMKVTKAKGLNATPYIRPLSSGSSAQRAAVGGISSSEHLLA